VEQWRATPEYTDLSEKLFLVTLTTKKLQDIATQAAQWGADQELEACCEWLTKYRKGFLGADLRFVRRPKSPSLKELALAALKRQAVRSVPSLIATEDCDTIRRALEALPE
jgi:hypothetical protein